MCGICGVVSQSPLGQAEKAAVRAMNRAMFRRGPDGEGFFEDTHCMLGMRRLAIIDLTGGWQPLYNEDQSVALVANGEVYNYVELRAELIARGHQLRTNSDCELPAHIYEDKGPEFVHDLRGMYAIAMWDKHRQRLTLVRDRMGEKPLFLFERTLPGGHKQLWFASEMRALLASGLVPFELDPGAVNEFMHFQWLHDPRTMVRGVRKLRAGSLLTVEPRAWKTDERVYWRMEDSPPIDAEPGPTIRAELDRIAELIIRSEVPVGVALSGGVDSSAVACLSARKYPGMMKAFSIGWAGSPAQDERGFARKLAKSLGMPFIEIEIAPSEVASFFPQLTVLQDDPIADITGYAYYALSKLARDHGCPVLLQGQGGDELFWGYAWARRALLETAYKLRHGHTRRTPMRDRFWPRDFTRGGLVGFAQQLGAWFYGWSPLGLPKDTNRDRLVYWDLIKPFQVADWARSRIYTDDFDRALGDHNAADSFTIPFPRPEAEILITKLLCQGYLLGNGINLGDRLAMANSVELRLPLVDYKLVQTVIGLRKAHKGDHLLGTKAWLRKAVEDVVPREIFERPKRGFNPPVTQWITTLLREHGEQLARGNLVASGILRKDMVERMGRPASRLQPWNQLFLYCLTLEMWMTGMKDICASARAGHAGAPAVLDASPVRQEPAQKSATP